MVSSNREPRSDSHSGANGVGANGVAAGSSLARSARAKTTSQYYVPHGLCSGVL